MGADTNAFMLPLFQTAGISPPVLHREGIYRYFYAVGGSGVFVLLMLYCMSVEPLLHCAEIPVCVLKVFYYFPVAAEVATDTSNDPSFLKFGNCFSNRSTRYSQNISHSLSCNFVILLDEFNYSL